ncbi:SgcJ/EcaC family oxidoreductase [Cellulomonas wangsupingiae]|uniref:SgcJ/EcaC family oxidoreductase n=1 Tax=Cellulomonas wangsupingiae TaxID=2968085 RepID=A0ABY5KBY1_9CELL|nr:SgcJ/EcaC family oxidoreductase [Cellulomonas wangsupingiae]MCC2334545.1 SgcJ/EcaC family oxidoreductase [Cellulomonas wangsupingiae]UUI66486.1 SgcJ/EcaC family oxidoreductase [Cellulomonas wangsupingiae]
MDATEAIDVTMSGIEASWSAGDARAFAALHAPTATYLAFDGTLMIGRHEIESGHAPLFRGIMRGSRLVSWDRHVRLVSPDVAVATQKGGIIMRWQGDRATPSAKRVSANTTVLVRDGDRWVVTAFQNTRYRPWAQTLVGRVMTRSTR